MTALQYFVNCEVCLPVDPTGCRESLMLLDLIAQDGPGWMPSWQQIDVIVYLAWRQAPMLNSVTFSLE
jgi:hypothetical protein